MNLTALFIRRPVMTALVMIGIIIFGVQGYRALPVSDLPNIDYPTLQVQANLPGASPETVETLITASLERQFGQIPGLVTMTSQSAESTSQITLQFVLNRDIDAVMEFYADDAELILPGTPPVKGKDAIRGAWQAYMTAFPDEHPTAIRHLADGSTAITEWAVAQTHTGPLVMPTGDVLPATGKAIKLSGVTIAELEEEKDENRDNRDSGRLRMS